MTDKSNSAAFAAVREVAPSSRDAVDRDDSSTRNRLVKHRPIATSRHDRSVLNMGVFGLASAFCMFVIAATVVTAEVTHFAAGADVSSSSRVDVSSRAASVDDDFVGPDHGNTGDTTSSRLAHGSSSPKAQPTAKVHSKSRVTNAGHASTSAFDGMSGPPGETSPLGIPVLVLRAYENAQQVLAANEPGCHLGWSILAGIGHTESDHADQGRVDATGTTRGHILGPVLDGHVPGTKVIKDTDHGLMDGNTSFDRAIGPMQFLPSTWRAIGIDANGDGVADPNNIFDATLTAANYLCSAGRDLSDAKQLHAAVLSYNNDEDYYTTVTTWAALYLSRATAVADGSLAVVSPSTPRPASNATRQVTTAHVRKPPQTEPKSATPTSAAPTSAPPTSPEPTSTASVSATSTHSPNASPSTSASTAGADPGPSASSGN